MKIKPTCSRVSVILVHHANEIQRIFSFMSYTLHAIKNKKFRVIKTTDWCVFLSTCHVKYKYKCLSVTNMLLKVNTSTDWMKDFHLKVLMRKTSMLRRSPYHFYSTHCYYLFYPKWFILFWVPNFWEINATWFESYETIIHESSSWVTNIYDYS